jgi:hypothetical protein
VQRRSPPWGHHFGADAGGGVLMWSGVALTASTTMGLGGVTPQSLDGGSILRCTCMEEYRLTPWRCHQHARRSLCGS